MDSSFPSAATEAENAPAPAAEVLSADLTKLQQKLATQEEDYLRLAAEFDNFKKRTRRDSERQAAAEKESFIHDLLPVLDNLERALASEQSVSPLTTTSRRGIDAARVGPVTPPSWDRGRQRRWSDVRSSPA